MDEAIYQAWMVRPSEAYYALSKAEKDTLFAKSEEMQRSAGTESLLMCNCSWAADEWLYFGLNRFANVDVMRKHNEGLLSIDWWRYIEAKSFLSRLDGPTQQLAAPTGDQMPIYKLSLTRVLSDGWRAPREQRDAVFAQLDEHRRKVGCETMFGGRIYSNENYHLVAVERFPSLAAVSVYNDCLFEMDWFQWVEAETLLGTLFTGM